MYDGDIAWSDLLSLVKGMMMVRVNTTLGQNFGGMECIITAAAELGSSSGGKEKKAKKKRLLQKHPTEAPAAEKTVAYRCLLLLLFLFFNHLIKLVTYTYSWNRHRYPPTASKQMH
eukprot:evm.model.NODE_38705_length_16377_cov_19.994871.3